MFADLTLQRTNDLQDYFDEIAHNPNHFEKSLYALNYAYIKIKNTGIITYEDIKKIISIARNVDIEQIELCKGRTSLGMHCRFMKLDGLKRIKQLSKKIILRVLNQSEDDNPWLANKTEYKESQEKYLNSSNYIVGYRDTFSNKELSELKQNIETLCKEYSNSRSLESLCLLIQYINSNHPFGDGHGRLSMTLIQAHLILYEQGQVAFWLNHNPNGLSIKQHIRMIRFGQELARRVNVCDKSKLSQEIQHLKTTCHLSNGLESSFSKLERKDLQHLKWFLKQEKL